ncbi:MAG: DUF1697 domain-containing protein [Candidatus Krumholzibacteria bacterium]|nr:DUF1697 domain-containing protein [Candidatus Krumholzibacteria bacterium]
MKMISLLRGINVSGQKKILMADLKRLYEGLGFTQVTTYIQSGNVVFETSDRRRKHLQNSIQSAIAAKYGFDVPVELRSRRDLQQVIANCPFAEVDLVAEGSRVAVVFLGDQPAASAVAKLAQHVHPPEKLVVMGREVYLHCPDGFGRTKLTNQMIEKKLGTVATARNWKTVLKLCELSG